MKRNGIATARMTSHDQSDSQMVTATGMDSASEEASVGWEGQADVDQSPGAGPIRIVPLEPVITLRSASMTATPHRSLEVSG